MEISIISELHNDWLVERFPVWRGLCNILEAWLLSSLPLPFRQVNMAGSCELIFRIFGRHHCKSRIFERMENFQNDCAVALGPKIDFVSGIIRQYSLRLRGIIVKYKEKRILYFMKSSRLYFCSENITEHIANVTCRELTWFSSLTI